MDAQTDDAAAVISAQWERIRQEERLDQARHVAEDAERDARIAAQLENSSPSSQASHRAR